MQTIGPYTVVEVLSRGVARIVYKVTSPGGKFLAMKTAAIADLSGAARETFEREGEVSSQLDHRNLLPAFETGEVDGLLYQVMDYLQGADLGTILAEKRALAWMRKEAIFQQVVEGLEYAHNRGLVHCDVSPGNIFVEDSGRVRLLDFGSAGTPSYRSPEQVQGLRCTPASDVFSLGVVLYELASGTHPFAEGAKDSAEVLHNIVNLPVSGVAATIPDAPQWLDPVLRLTLQKSADRRPRDAGVLRTLMASPSSVAKAVAAAGKSELDTTMARKRPLA